LRIEINRCPEKRTRPCHQHQHDEPFFTYHIEHIIPRQHGGTDDESNRALACYHCNLHKGPNLSGIDPENGAIVPLFDPRTQRWSDHFEWRGIIVVGRTPVGRATVRVLAMNALARLNIRGNSQSKLE
jgi:hypothetical protein